MTIVANNIDMKKQKIVITGGLGYIGSELCKLYSGETRYKDIVVTDIKFASERVKQLRDWGFEFIQASILDQNKMKEILADRKSTRLNSSHSSVSRMPSSA